MSRVLLCVNRNIFYVLKVPPAVKIKKDSVMIKGIARTLRGKLKIRNNSLLFLTGTQLFRNKEVIISLNRLFTLHTSNLYTSFFFYFIQLYSIFVSSFGYKLFRGHESSSVNSFINLNKKGRTIH